jgi:hypothetical protein
MQLWNASEAEISEIVVRLSLKECCFIVLPLPGSGSSSVSHQLRIIQFHRCGGVKLMPLGVYNEFLLSHMRIPP